MKSRLTNNLGLKLTALFFSVFLWLFVVNVSDPVDTKRFLKEVQVVNPEIITNEGRNYQILEDTKVVSVTVKAKRSVLEKIKSENIQATADFRELQGASVPVRIKINGFEGSYEEASANPQNIQIKTENVEKKTFPVTPVVTGELQEGYVIGELTAEPESIDVSGPKSTLGRISKVVATVDVSELSEDTSLKAKLTYYDSADNVLDESLLSSNVDAKGVMVNVHLLDTKTVELKFDESEIGTKKGYGVAGIETEPQNIVVSGTKETLDELEYIEIGSEALRQDDLDSNTEVIVDISQYLPEGVTLADADANKVVVNILVEKEGVKTITIPVRSVKVNNVPEGMELTYGDEQEVQLRFGGVEDILNTMSAEKISATIDLKDYKEEGTYDVPVRIGSLPEGCSYIEEATVQIILKKK